MRGVLIMKSKKFYLWLMIAAFAFAIFSLGGCGGGHSGSISGNSSGNGGNGGNDGETSQSALSLMSKSVESSDMAAVMATDKFTSLITDVSLKQGDYKDIPDTHFFFKFDDETKTRILSELSGDEKEIAEGFFFTSEDAKERYDNGEVLILVAPDKNFVNQALEAVGLNGDYNDERQLEAFAFAKREISKDVESGDVILTKIRTYNFSYTVQHVDNVEISADETPSTTDEESNDISLTLESAETENTNETRTVEEFNVARWENMFKWCLTFDDVLKETEVEASSIEFNAAAVNDITKVSSVQVKTLDLSYKNDGYIVAKWIWNQVVPIDREISVTAKIFNCHSYSEGNDYYFVSTNNLTTPRGFGSKVIKYSNRVIKGATAKFAYGYTKEFRLYFQDDSHELARGAEAGAVVDGDNAYPKTTEKGESNGYNLVWNRAGLIGTGTELFTDLSYTASADFRTTDKWSLGGYFSDTFAHDIYWHGEIDAPVKGEQTEYGYDIDVPNEAKTPFTLDTNFIWKVGKRAWQRNRNLPVEVTFEWYDGYCLGEFRTVVDSKPVTEPMNFVEIYLKKSGIIGVEMPQHSWTHMDAYTFTNKGDRASFEFLTEGTAWQLSAKDSDGNNADWITFESPSGNGPITEKGTWLGFTVSENNTGKPRRATIQVTSTLENNISETLNIAVMQSE